MTCRVAALLKIQQRYNIDEYLVGKLGYESDQSSNYLKQNNKKCINPQKFARKQFEIYLEHFVLILPCQFLHKILQEEVAVLDQEVPNDLVRHLVDRDAVGCDGLVLQQPDDLGEGGADGGGQQGLWTSFEPGR